MHTSRNYNLYTAQMSTSATGVGHGCLPAACQLLIDLQLLFREELEVANSGNAGRAWPRR